MKRIRLRYSEVVCLYANLRCIELSLDRGRWPTYWKSMVEYLLLKVTPADLANQFGAFIRQTPTPVMIPRFFYGPALPRRLFRRFRALFRCDVAIELSSLQAIVKVLADLDVLLKSDQTEYSLIAEKIRSQAATSCYNLLEHRIAAADVRMLARVEHFLNAFGVLHLKLQNFCTGNELK